MRVLPTFVIGLREGLEAALIVGIVAAFLGLQGRRDALRQVWIGVSIAVCICIGIGVGLQIVSHNLPQRQQEGLETVVGGIAVVMVTYMVLWMRGHARDLKGDLEKAAGSALAEGSSRALVVMAFLAVLREGFETVVFLLATFHASGDATLSWVGALSGILLAVVIGYGIYKGGVHINLSRFFRVTGIVLVVIAAGLVMTGVHTANEAGWLNLGQTQALDLSWLVRPGTPLESFVTGVLGIQPYPVDVEVLAWVAYLLPMLVVMCWPSRPRSRTIPRAFRRSSVAVAVLTVAAVVVAGCGSRAHSSSTAAKSAATGSTDQTKTVDITLTSQGCAPVPSTVTTGDIQFNVSNKNAGAVSEAELRTSSLSHLLGEQENVTPGLSGGFELTVEPGSYIINCPGAKHAHATFAVTGTAKTVSQADTNTLATAVSAYATYVNQQTALLVSSSQTMCNDITARNMAQAKIDYPKARIYYERIEPVASVWGTLDTAIDGRIDNPVTNPADLEGFHRIEELMWADNTLGGAAGFCRDLIKNEQQLQTLVGTASYNAVTVASGATDLINEASDSKITGEEERYSNTDFLVFQANVDGAMEVVNVFRAYLQTADPSLLAMIDQWHAAVEAAIAKYKTTPGYDNTGYVEYSAVTDSERKRLSGVVQAFAEALSKIPGQVG